MARGEQEAVGAYRGKWAFLLIPMAINILYSFVDSLMKLLKLVIPGGSEWVSFIQSNIFSFLQNAGIAAAGWATFFENYVTYTGDKQSDGIKQIYSEIARLYQQVHNQSMQTPPEVLQAKRYIIANLVTSTIGAILPFISFLLLGVGSLDAKLKKINNTSNNLGNCTSPSESYETIIDPWGAFAANVIGNLLSIVAVILIIASYKFIAPRLNAILNQARQELKDLKRTNEAKLVEQEQNKEKQLEQTLEEERSERKQLEHAQPDIDEAVQTLEELHKWSLAYIARIISDNFQQEEFNQEFTQRMAKIKSHLQTSQAQDDSELEQQLNLAALESQRSIAQLLQGNQIKLCQVVPAEPDGNCGFTSIRYSLILQGKTTLAEQINRTAFIECVAELYQSETTPQDIRELMSDILKVDRAASIEDWRHKFQASGYWLQEAHLKLLSKIYNLRFEIYYLSPEQGENYFKPEPSYEAIDEGTGETATIALVHVSTQLKDSHDATLNHFDAIIIEPTEEQQKKIAELKRMAAKEAFPHEPRSKHKSPTSLVHLMIKNSPIFTGSIATHKADDSQESILALNKALTLAIKQHEWRLEQAGHTLTLTLLEDFEMSDTVLNELREIMIQTFNLTEQQVIKQNDNLSRVTDNQLLIRTESEPLANRIKEYLAHSELQLTFQAGESTGIQLSR